MPDSTSTSFDAPPSVYDAPRNHPIYTRLPTEMYEELVKRANGGKLTDAIVDAIGVGLGYTPRSVLELQALLNDPRVDSIEVLPNGEVRAIG